MSPDTHTDTHTRSDPKASLEIDQSLLITIASLIQGVCFCLTQKTSLRQNRAKNTHRFSIKHFLYVCNHHFLNIKLASNNLLR